MYKVLVVLISTLLFSTLVFATRPSEQFVWLGNPAWQAEFDAGGYSDCFYWGYSENKHEYSSHEMLSGEYGAAIYYTGINNNQSMWLSNEWLYPDWTTNCNFDWISNNSWNNASNPLEPFYPFVTNYHGNQTAYDTAQSVIVNNDVRVTIDYNMIDLGENGYAAVPFYPQGYSGSDVPYSKSERYVLIQTYNIKNVKAI